MALPFTFATLSGNVPASDLDANFTYLNTSPSLTSPTVVTPSTADNSTLVASTAFVNNLFTANSPTSYTGFRNRIINGDMRIDQRNSGSSQTVAAAAAAVYTVDRMYATCTGANVTGQRVAGSGVDQYQYQFTGAASVTGIAFGQRIEATNIWDQEGATVSLGVKLANSLLTTVTWTAYYPTATDNWASRTSISTGTFTVTSTLTKYTATISLPSNVIAGLEIELSVGAQTSGTWQITEFQLEAGSTATPFERLPYQVQFAQCQRYYQTHNLFCGGYVSGAGGGVQSISMFPVQMRTVPSPSITAISYNNASGGGFYTLYVDSYILSANVTTASYGGVASGTSNFNSEL